MTKELDELKRRMKSDKNTLRIDYVFNTYSKIYTHSNENLKEYIKDLKDKKVLCVGASGDHLLNSLVAGSTEIDTFDINRYSRLFIELRLAAIKYLDNEEALSFLKEFDKDLYLKFHNKLTYDIKEVFDYLLLNFSKEIIYKKFVQDTSSSFNNNNYDSIEKLKLLKKQVERLQHRHYSCDIYELYRYLKDSYDVIYLSNILGYEHDYDKLFSLVRLLRSDYLNSNGEIFYNYLWTTNPNGEKRTLFNRFGSYQISDYMISKYSDIYDDTEEVRIKSIYDNDQFSSERLFTDSLLRIKKER